MHRIKVSSWTSGFRYPNLISGYQASLPAPPLSTVYGIVSAAAGFNIINLKPDLGYYFECTGSAVDLEKIYQFQEKKNIAKSNVVRREILSESTLYIYIYNDNIAEYFTKPHYQILLGRSQDLAQIDYVKQVDLEPKQVLNKLRGTVIPFDKAKIAAPIQALPHHFSDSFVRENIRVKPYFLLKPQYRQRKPIEAKGYYDKELDVDIYWHCWED